MKFLAILASLAALTCAQNISVPEPANNATLSAGQNTSVVVADSSASETDLSVSIALQPISGPLGAVLYNGTYDPKFGPGDLEVPVQVFSVLVPADFERGAALLNVVVTSADSSICPETTKVAVNVA